MALRKCSNKVESAIDWIVQSSEASTVDDDMVTHADDDVPALVPSETPTENQYKPTWDIGSTASFSDAISGVSTTGQIAAASAAVTG